MFSTLGALAMIASGTSAIGPSFGLLPASRLGPRFPVPAEGMTEMLSGGGETVVLQASHLVFPLSVTGQPSTPHPWARLCPFAALIRT